MNTVLTPRQGESYEDAKARLEVIQSAQSAVIGAYMDAARKLWDMPNARDCEIRARAWAVAEGYHERAIQGEDAGVRGYIANLPPSLALEYATAITLSTQIRSECKIHHVTMWTQRDGKCSHWVDTARGKVRCFGLNSQDGGGNWSLADNYCDGVPAYDAEDAAADHADAIAEMPELAGMVGK